MIKYELHAAIKTYSACMIVYDSSIEEQMNGLVDDIDKHNDQVG